MTISWIVIFILYDIVHSELDPCIVHQEFNDTSLRTDRYFVGNSLPCESFPSSPVPTWYRYTGNVGGTMATGCPERSTCTAREQIWIQGSLPSFHGDIKQVEICINKGSDCCVLENFIRVKNCNFFYVYELRRTPNCETKYCFNATAVPLVTQSTLPTTVVPETAKISQSITIGGKSVTNSTTSTLSTKSSTRIITSKTLSPSTQKITKQYSSSGFKYTSLPSVISTRASLPAKQTTNPTTSLTQSSQLEGFSRTVSIPATITVIVNNRTSTKEIWKQKSSENSLSSGTIIAIAVGTGCVVIIILAAVIVILHKRKIFKADPGKRSATYKVHKQENSQLQFNLETDNIS